MSVELPGHEIVRVEGRDALAFLQAQLAGDLRPLADGDRAWNCYLTPQGRVQSVFAVARESAERFALHVPERMAAAVAERLKRYVFRSKVALAVEPGAAVDDDAARRRCIAIGLPLIAAPVADTFTAHALSLERFDAFSTSKGCYPGQEIIARTHFKGRSKRALVRVAGDGEPPAPGARLGDAEVVCAAPDGGGFEALAVLHEDAGVPPSLRRVDFAQAAAE
jgi:folate-binding protein YgfZ